MNVTFFDTHPRTKLIYYTLAFFTSIIVWIAAIFSVSASSYVLIIGTGINVGAWNCFAIAVEFINDNVCL